MKKRISSALICVFLAAVATVAVLRLVDFRHEEAAPFFALVATIAGTLLGFAMTSLAILVSVSDSKLLNNMKKVGLYEMLVRGIYSAGAALFLTMLASVALFFYANSISVAIVVFLFVFALTRLWSVGRKFFIVLEALGEPKGDKRNID